LRLFEKGVGEVIAIVNLMLILNSQHKEDEHENDRQPISFFRQPLNIGGLWRFQKTVAVWKEMTPPMSRNHVVGQASRLSPS
jgi:hypothetical protein